MAWCVSEMGLLRVVSIFLMLSSVSVVHVDTNGMFLCVSLVYNSVNDFL